MKKQAILLVHFGTTHDDTREKTIDVFRKKVESLFPDCDIFEAFTSRMIIKRLKARGIFRKNPLELLEELKEQGYTHIYVQSSHLLHGIEYENLRSEEHTSELQSRQYLVCRLLLEKKKKEN